MPAAAGTYQFRLFWNDSAQLLATSGTVSVGAATNQAPQVFIASPAAGAAYAAGSDVAVTAAATDADGSVVNVKLYLSGQFIHQENVAPYEWGMAGQNDSMLARMAAGTYELTAVATDDQGATATSAVVPFTVHAVGGGGGGGGPSAGSTSGRAGGGSGCCGLTGAEALLLLAAMRRRHRLRTVCARR